MSKKRQKSHHHVRTSKKELGLSKPSLGLNLDAGNMRIKSAGATQSVACTTMHFPLEPYKMVTSWPSFHQCSVVSVHNMSVGMGGGMDD